MIYAHDDAKHSPTEKIGVERIGCDDGVLSIETVNSDKLPYHIERAIFRAEQDSLNVCEFCGATANVGTTMNNTYKTCCKECWETKILAWTPNSIWKDYTTNKTFKMK
jgi:hypothetical protein